jgi:hypothetical protein
MMGEVWRSQESPRLLKGAPKDVWGVDGIMESSVEFGKIRGAG